MEQHQRGRLQTVEWTAGNDPVERLVVLCHGYGAGGDDLVGIGQAFGVDGPTTRWVCPAAPLKPPEMSSWGGRAWWNLRVSDLASGLDSATSLADHMRTIAMQTPAGLIDAVNALKTAVDEARTNYQDVPWIIGGFSQGAMITSYLLGTGLISPNGYVAFSGCPIGLSEWSETLAKPPNALVTHGRVDPVLPYAGGELLRSELSSRGADVDFVAFDGQHEIPTAALIAFNGLLMRILGEHATPDSSAD